MDFRANVGLLREALTTARHATPVTPSIAAFAAVNFKLKGSELSITGGDGATTITATLEVDPTGKSKGEELILPKPLGNFLGNLGSNETVHVTSNEEGISVAPEGSSAYSFRRIVSTFPASSPPSTAARSVDLSRLESALGAIRATCSKDKPGVQLASSSSGLTLHSTDSYRLSQAVLPEAGFGDFAGVLPLGILERIARLDIRSITIAQKNRALHFEGPNVTVTTQLMSSPFPDVEDLLNSAPPSSVELNTGDFRRALSRLSSVADPQMPIKMRLEDNRAVFSVSNIDLGNGSETIDLASDVVAPFECHFKLVYLADLVSSYDTETMKLSYSSPLSTVYVSSVDPIKLTTLVMPIKVNS